MKLGGRLLPADGIAARLAPWRHDGLVVVHGGGAQIGDYLQRLGHGPSRFVDGLRVTTETTMPVVAMVLAGLLNPALVLACAQAGMAAVGLTGVDGALLTAHAQQGLDGLPMERTGGVQAVHPALLQQLVTAGYVPVVAPIARGPAGLYNINADEAAAALAGALRVRLAVLLTDTPGVLDEQHATIASLDAHGVEALLASGIARGGMVPKLRAALAALAAGCEEVVIAAEDALEAALRGENGQLTRLRLS